MTFMHCTGNYVIMIQLVLHNYDFLYPHVDYMFVLRQFVHASDITYSSSFNAVCTLHEMASIRNQKFFVEKAHSLKNIRLFV